MTPARVYAQASRASSSREWIFGIAIASETGGSIREFYARNGGAERASATG